MGVSCNCCWCWKRKPSVNPTAQTISTNPSTTNSPNQSQTLISPPSSPSKKPPPTLEEVISNFKNVDIESQADGFIKAIQEFLKTAQKHTQDTPSTSSSHKDKLSNWDSIIQSGGKFLKFVNEHTKEIKIDTKEEFFQSGKATEIVGDILKQIGQLHWAVAALSTVGYLVSKCAKMSKNKAECLELLREMITLVIHIKDLNTHIIEEKEKFEEAFQYIMEASISCASQLQSGKFFSFLKSAVDSETLTAIRTKINGLYSDLILTATRKIIRQKTVSRPLLPEDYPSYAVGIEDQLKAVNEILNMENMEHCSSFAVVIWGLGGIGKTTLANAVVSTVDRNSYNYARIELDLVSDKNNYKEMQQQILKDGFPGYEEGRKIELRNDADGRAHLKKAFKSAGNKSVFLFIDNALHMKDLERILPEDLRGLPERSRILITTRTLNETDVLEERGLQRKDYPVETLSDDHALTILCNEPAIRDAMKHDLQEIIKLCNGIPLVLKIVAAHLHKQKYKADRCTQILGALRTGGKIKEKDLSDCLFDFVYNKLEESTQEAFLDICCFFYYKNLYDHWSRRYVEYIVGAEEVTSLVDAALITRAMKDKEEMLSIHDIIFSIGRSMSKSSRILDENSWFEAEKDEGKLKGIKGVWIQNSKHVLEKRHLDSMKDKLRVLIWLGNIDIQARDAVTLPEIRCIKTHSDISGLNLEAFHKLGLLECKKLPTKERDQLKLPESLRRIELERQPCETKELSKTEPNSSLEELFIYSSYEEGDLSNDEKDNREKTFNKLLQGLNKLEHLKVVGNWSLCRLPQQVCILQQLSTLGLIGWKKLECLPELLGKLTSLKKLDLSWCESLIELPASFCQLTELRYLDLQGCESLKELPSTFGQFRVLEYLDLSYCKSLEELSSTFDQLTTLRILNLSYCRSLKEWSSIINNFNNLKSLEQVTLNSSIHHMLDICQMDDNVKLVKKIGHNCTNCRKDKKLKIIRTH